MAAYFQETSGVTRRCVTPPTARRRLRSRWRSLAVGARTNRRSGCAANCGARGPAVALILEGVSWEKIKADARDETLPEMF